MSNYWGEQRSSLLIKAVLSYQPPFAVTRRLAVARGGQACGLDPDLVFQISFSAF
jgi:hypothetical protein